MQGNVRENMKLSWDHFSDQKQVKYIHRHSCTDVPRSLGVAQHALMLLCVSEHYFTLSGLIRELIISLECFIEITPDFLIELHAQ